MHALEVRLNLTTGLRNFIVKAVICALLLAAAAKPADASIPTQSDVVWIGIAIGAIGAGIGIGIYYAVHHNHSLTGCVISGADGLQLQSRGDQQTYLLVGDVAGIKPGERIHVSGKKAKAANGAGPQFIVEKLGKDYGSCKVSTAAP
jgi:hypothetical protein